MYILGRKREDADRKLMNRFNQDVQMLSTSTLSPCEICFIVISSDQDFRYIYETGT